MYQAVRAMYQAVRAVHPGDARPQAAVEGGEQVYVAVVWALVDHFNQVLRWAAATTGPDLTDK